MFDLYEYELFKNCVPLKTGIKQDLLKKLFEQHPDQSRTSIRKIVGVKLNNHCSNRAYRKSMIVGATRYDLNMQPAGVVTAEQIEAAKKAIADMKAAGKAKAKSQREAKAAEKWEALCAADPTLQATYDAKQKAMIAIERLRGESAQNRLRLLRMLQLKCRVSRKKPQML